MTPNTPSPIHKDFILPSVSFVCFLDVFATGIRLYFIIPDEFRPSCL